MDRGFITLPSWSEAFRAFTKSRSTADILVYINEYWTTGTEPKMPEKGEVTVAWRLIKPLLDAQKQAREYGKRGGAPLGNQNARKTTPVETTKTTENNPRCLEYKQPKTTKITDNSIKITDTPPISPLGGNGSGKPSPAFVKPTLDELREYIGRKGYHFTAEEFIAHYESNGWMVGRNHMKSWRMACVTWEHSPYRKKTTLQEQARGTGKEIDIGF